MKLNLRESESEILEIWKDSPIFRLSRRAWLVSESAKGIDSKVLSKAVAMPEQRVLEVIDRYRQIGILGLIENPRSGRARKIPTGAVKNLMIDLLYKSEGEFDINDIARKIKYDHGEKISKDLIWQQARRDGLILKRHTAKNIQIKADQILKDIIGIAVTASVTIIVAIKMKRDQPISGYLEVLSRDMLNVLTKENITILSSMKDLANLGEFTKKERTKKEAMLRWAYGLSRVAQREGVSLQIEVCGDYKTSEMMEWLKALKANQLIEGISGQEVKVRFVLKEDDMRLAKKELVDAINHLKLSSSEYIWSKRLVL